MGYFDKKNFKHNRILFDYYLGEVRDKVKDVYARMVNRIPTGRTGWSDLLLNELAYTMIQSTSTIKTSFKRIKRWVNNLIEDIVEDEMKYRKVIITLLTMAIISAGTLIIEHQLPRIKRERYIRRLKERTRKEHVETTSKLNEYLSKLREERKEIEERQKRIDRLLNRLDSLVLDYEMTNQLLIWQIRLSGLSDYSITNELRYTVPTTQDRVTPPRVKPDYTIPQLVERQTPEERALALLDSMDTILKSEVRLIERIERLTGRDKESTDLQEKTRIMTDKVRKNKGEQTPIRPRRLKKLKI